MRCGAELRDGSTHSRSAGRAPARPLRTDRTNRGAGRGGRNGDRGRVPPLLAETRRCCARRVTAEGSLRAAAAVELPWHRRGFPELGRFEAPGQGKRSLVVPAAWSRARRGCGLGGRGVRPHGWARNGTPRCGLLEGGVAGRAGALGRPGEETRRRGGAENGPAWDLLVVTLPEERFLPWDPSRLYFPPPPLPFPARFPFRISPWNPNPRCCESSPRGTFLCSGAGTSRAYITLSLVLQTGWAACSTELS